MSKGVRFSIVFVVLLCSASVAAKQVPPKQAFIEKYRAMAIAFSRKDSPTYFSYWSPDIVVTFKEKGVPKQWRRTEAANDIGRMMNEAKLPRAQFKIAAIDYDPVNDTVVALLRACFNDDAQGPKTFGCSHRKHTWVRQGTDWLLDMDNILREITYNDFTSASGLVITTPDRTPKPVIQVKPIEKREPSPDEKTRLARMHYLRGERAAIRGNRLTAIREWKKALEYKPDSEHTKRRLDQAMAALSKPSAVRIAPRRPAEPKPSAAPSHSAPLPQDFYDPPELN